MPLQRIEMHLFSEEQQDFWQEAQFFIYLFIFVCLTHFLSFFSVSSFSSFISQCFFFCRRAVTDTLCTHVRGRTSSPAPPGVERPSRLSVTRCFLRASRCVKCENDQGGRRRGSTIRNKNHHTGPAVR